MIFDSHVLQLGGNLKPIFVLMLTMILAFLMVSTVKYRSFKELKFTRGRMFNYLVWSILILMLIVAWPPGMLFMACMGYALSGPLERGFALCSKAMGKRGAAGSEQVVPETKE